MNKQDKREIKKSTGADAEGSRPEKLAEEAMREKDSISRRILEIEEHDRKLIRHELYEVIGQSLAVLKLSIHRVRLSLVDGIQSASAETEALADGMIEQLRIIADTLLPSTLDDFGLLKALEDLFQKYTDSTDIKINFHNEGLERSMPVEIEAMIYRIIRETLLNVVSQAQVSEIYIGARIKDNMASLNIAVAGDGFNAFRDDSGQTIMRERVLLLGGNLSIETLPDMIRLSSELPIADNYHEPDVIHGQSITS